MTRRPLPRRAILTALAVVLALGIWSGCASGVRPPADVTDPVTIHLLATGRHAAVLLPRDAERVVEYGYGDWGWYALCHDDWWRAPATVLWPNPGTLGRREVAARRVSTAPGAYEGGTLSALVVSREFAERLLARLDAEFAAGGAPVFNPVYDMSFVPHTDRYWAFHDCHDQVAAWLEDLGCDVGWAPVRTGLEVVPTGD
ncbi:MAG: hypothetical protein K8T90_18405 [Planctomycetes bacterium]|nr:hypothetical protein [Planctomycetota bacterium]